MPACQAFVRRALGSTSVRAVKARLRCFRTSKPAWVLVLQPRWVSLLLVLVLAAASVLAASAQSDAAPLPRKIGAADVITMWISPDSQYVVYAAWRGGKHTLWSVPRNGAGQVELTRLLPPGATSNWFNATITPDSRALLFFGGLDGKGVIWRVPITGGTPVPLVQLANAAQRFYDFYVTPDGRRVVFAVDEPAQLTTARHIYSVPMDGGAVVSLDPPLGSDQYIKELALSPDGTRVLYYVAHSSLGVGDPFTLWSAPVDGGTPVALTSEPTYNAGQHFLITPDSNYALFYRQTTSYGEADLWVVPLAGGAAWRLSAPADSSAGSAWISADSRYVVYQAGYAGSAHAGLFSAPLEPGKPFVLLSDPAFWIGPVALIADSRYVVYLSDRAGVDPGNFKNDLRTVAIAGGASVSLRPAAVDNIGSTVKLAPDGSRVLFWDAGNDALYSAPADGSTPGVNLTPNQPLLARVLDGDMQLSADGSAAFYRVSADNGDALFDFRVQPAAGGQAVSLRGDVETVGGAHASDFDYWFTLSPDGTFAVFRGGTTPEGTRALYQVELPAAPAPPAASTAPAPTPVASPSGPPSRVPGPSLPYQRWIPATAR